MRKSSLILMTLLLTFLVAFPALAAPGSDVVRVQNNGDHLIFTPIVEFERMVLTVTGPCAFEYTQEINEGELVFPLGAETINGRYRFNVFAHEWIDPDTIETLLQARSKNDEETPKLLCREGRLPAPPSAQSGGFLVQQGEIVYDPNAFEKADRGDADVPMRTAAVKASFPEYSNGNASRVPTKDFVIIDDLIVDGSACIGFDCVNGESFGFDTIRLKENNLRIKFDDTSTAASFPRNDWQLTANDSANGGASKFSIDDISGSRTPFTVEANARSHSLYVDDGGRIGSRTSTPSTEIHTIDGDTPTLRLQQDGSSGFAPQTWDVAGNETNFFVRDVTNGSTLPFRIRPGAPSSAIFIDVNGDVGIGHSSPDDKLHVKETGCGSSGCFLARLEADGKARYVMEDTSDGGTEWSFDAEKTAGADAFHVSKIGTGVNELTLDNSGNLTITGQLTTAGNTYPDYVFEAGYDLMSLDDLAAYIDENGHLPNIPSAAETNNGARINMTELQIKMLEKIEELTLYTLEQQETIQDLRARLAALEEGKK